MSTQNEVYMKFGAVSQSAQSLETELGTLLLEHRCVDEDLFKHRDSDKATEIYDHINKMTLGRLVKILCKTEESVAAFEQLLHDALTARNKLTHSFFLHHNLRMYSDGGRDVMLADLDELHKIIFKAHKEMLLLSGYDVDAMAEKSDGILVPTGHLPIRTC